MCCWDLIRSDDIVKKRNPGRKPGRGILLPEEIVDAIQEQADDDQRKDPGHVESHPIHNFQTLAGIGFGGELVPTPAAAGG